MICTEANKSKDLRWVVHLNDGTVVYEDIQERDSWYSLKDHCEENNLHIVKYYIQFRSNTKELPPKRDGYYFCRGIGAVLNSEINLDYYITGWIDGDKVRYKKWKVPELIEVQEGVRGLVQCRPQLISKNTTQ